MPSARACICLRKRKNNINFKPFAITTRASKWKQWWILFFLTSYWYLKIQNKEEFSSFQPLWHSLTNSMHCHGLLHYDFMRWLQILEYADENPLTKISATTIISIDRWNFLQTPKTKKRNWFQNQSPYENGIITISHKQLHMMYAISLLEHGIFGVNSRMHHVNALFLNVLELLPKCC